MNETTQKTRTAVEQLLALVREGRVPEAIDRFYGDNVAMQENLNPPTVGKAENRAREEAFGASIAELHALETPAIVVDGNRAVIHWIIDYTSTDGQRFRFDEVALQTWEDGKIVHERFIYDPNDLTA